jgi:hypothetical protein
MSPNSADHTAIIIAIGIMSLLNIFVFAIVMLFANVETALAVLAVLIVIAALSIWQASKPPKEPVQDINILVDLPPGTDVKVAPLLLNSVDSTLFRFLLPKCTQTIDQGKIFLHYKGSYGLYNPLQNVFQIKGTVYKPTLLKVVYYTPP